LLILAIGSIWTQVFLSPLEVGAQGLSQFFTPVGLLQLRLAGHLDSFGYRASAVNGGAGPVALPRRLWQERSTLMIASLP
jgi:hypothetical protein